MYNCFSPPLEPRLFVFSVFLDTRAEILISLVISLGNSRVSVSAHFREAQPQAVLKLNEHRTPAAPPRGRRVRVRVLLFRLT